MAKIDDLPSLSLDSSYEDNFLLAANGYDDNGDYVTGQVSSYDIIINYIKYHTDWQGPIFPERAQFLFAAYYNDDFYLGGQTLSDAASNIASSISENDYLYDYISSSISDYVYNGYLSNYLSDFISNYVTEGRLNSYITSQIGSYVNNMPTRECTSEISGVVVKYDNELAYVDGSNFEAIVRSCVFYYEAQPIYLSDATELAGLYLSATMPGVGGYITPITLGDIVSYVRAHL